MTYPMMPEHENRQLGPDVHEALRLARRLTGREPAVRRLPHLPGEARAMLVRPKPHQPTYEIRYAHGQERVLQHLIAHKVGHLVRLAQVPEAERLTAAVTPTTRLQAARQAEPELVSLLQRGVPPATVAELFTTLH